MAKQQYEVLGNRAVFGVEPGNQVKLVPNAASTQRRVAAGQLRKKSSPSKGKGKNRSSS